MTARRIPGAPSDGSRGPLVTFTFDGRTYEGVEGEPLAAALLAADRSILSRSFRFHRPRGLMCSTGQCGWCECEVDGRPSVRSCRVPVRAGLVARGEHAWPSVERDLLASVGLVSRWIPPTFYHHRFLRPRPLRKRYLDVLRWFGGRGRLELDRSAAAPRQAGRPTRKLEPDVLVVGGGPAGLAAAVAAAEAGARVVVLEADMTGSSAVEVEILRGVVATGWYDGLVTAVGADAHLEIRAGAVVAATGSYDRVPLVPGNDRPGVMAARTVIGLIERYDILPGQRALLVGSGPELASAGERLVAAGASTVVGPVSAASLVTIRGRDRVTGATTRHGRSTEHHAVDLVVFADRSPNLDLALAAGAVIGRKDDTLVPIVDASGRTTVANLFVAGSAAGRPVSGPSGIEFARAAGRTAADVAAGRTDSATPPLAASGSGSTGATSPVARGAMVCFCEDIRAWEIRAEQAAGYTDPELIKRRTGALTGPCQGKSCVQAFAALCADRPGESVAGLAAAGLPTARPPLRPVRLGDLVAVDAEATSARDVT